MVRSTTSSLDLSRLCRAIMGCNSNIQAVEVMTKSGHSLENIAAHKVSKAKTEEGKSGLCLLEISLGDEFEDLYGPIQYHFSQGNSATFTFPFGENMVVVTATKCIGPISIATKIAQVISRFG